MATLHRSNGSASHLSLHEVLCNIALWAFYFQKAHQFQALLNVVSFMQQNHSLYHCVSSFPMVDHSILHPLLPVLLLSQHMVYPVALHQTVDVLPLPMTPCVFSLVVQSFLQLKDLVFLNLSVRKLMRIFPPHDLVWR